MPTEIIVSILTGLGTLAGVLISNSRSQSGYPVTDQTISDKEERKWNAIKKSCKSLTYVMMKLISLVLDIGVVVYLYYMVI